MWLCGTFHTNESLQQSEFFAQTNDKGIKGEEIEGEK